MGWEERPVDFEISSGNRGSGANPILHRWEGRGRRKSYLEKKKGGERDPLWKHKSRGKLP